MLSAVLLIRVVPVAAAIMLSAAALATAERPSGAARLPDLVQVVPSELEITFTGPPARRRPSPPTRLRTAPGATLPR